MTAMYAAAKKSQGRSRKGHKSHTSKNNYSSYDACSSINDYSLVDCMAIELEREDSKLKGFIAKVRSEYEILASEKLAALKEECQKIAKQKEKLEGPYYMLYEHLNAMSIKSEYNAPAFKIEILNSYYDFFENLKYDEEKDIWTIDKSQLSYLNSSIDYYSEKSQRYCVERDNLINKRKNIFKRRKVSKESIDKIQEEIDTFNNDYEREIAIKSIFQQIEKYLNEHKEIGKNILEARAKIRELLDEQELIRDQIAQVSPGRFNSKLVEEALNKMLEEEKITQEEIDEVFSTIEKYDFIYTRGLGEKHKYYYSNSRFEKEFLSWFISNVYTVSLLEEKEEDLSEEDAMKLTLKKNN